jgi:hypothetical protein
MSACSQFPRLRSTDFFSSNPRTYFCQINIVRLMEGCSYSDQLGVVFASRYGVGNLNASLFATEGIASVGLIWSPMVLFLCGIVLSVGNGCSRHLPAPMMATSSALAFQALLNVPLSTALLTNGVLLLFLLWYICPVGVANAARHPKKPLDGPFPGGRHIDSAAGEGKLEHKKLRRRARNVVSRRRLSLGP